MIPNAYTLRHARGYGRSALRNWQFQVSKDGVTWTTLYDHLDDQSLNDPGSTGTWQLSPSKDEKQGWRHIRLQQGGKNASGQTHYLSLSGFELYGTVTGVCDELGNYSHILLAYSVDSIKGTVLLIETKYGKVIVSQMLKSKQRRMLNPSKEGC